jgi:hypothetical protein
VIQFRSQYLYRGAQLSALIFEVHWYLLGEFALSLSCRDHNQTISFALSYFIPADTTNLANTFKADLKCLNIIIKSSGSLTFGKCSNPV